MIYRLTHQLITVVQNYDGINDKGKLAQILARQFGLVQERSVYHCSEFAIRFSKASGKSFSNTVLSLSNLQQYDHKPFLVCVVCPDRNILLLANTTFLVKISHSSQELRINNIKGSFNGSDISKVFQGIDNVPENFEVLFRIHSSVGFSGNLARLVESTHDISPTGHKFEVAAQQHSVIWDAPDRAARFIASYEYLDLLYDLNQRVDRCKNEIVLASQIENVNLRGRVIEYLVSGADEALRHSLQAALHARKSLPEFLTDNSLGDYTRRYEQYLIETDVKSKMMELDSNPKAYNVDKMLAFLSQEQSVFMLYFIGDAGNRIKTALVSMFQPSLLQATLTWPHWAGRNSRGVTQFNGKVIKKIILANETGVDVMGGRQFLNQLLRCNP